MKLQNKVAVITGGASGIGKVSAELFLKEGASVIIADYDEEKGKQTELELKPLGNVVFQTLDVSDMYDVNALAEYVATFYGQIDILINNAGVTDDSTTVKMTHKQWDRVISINQTGVFNCVKAFAPMMIEKGYGKIVNTSSIVGRFGNFGQANYAATKAAVIAMTQTWSREFGRKGITVNAVAPGFIKTSMTEQMPEKILKNTEEKVALQRLGTPLEVANAYLFLSSEDSTYVTGAVIPVDGGLFF